MPNCMLLPDTLHLCGRYLITPRGTTGAGDNLSRGESRREGTDSMRQIWIWQPGRTRWRDEEREVEGLRRRIGVTMGGSIVRWDIHSDSAGVRKECTLSVFSLSARLCLRPQPILSPFFSLSPICRGNSPLGVTGETKEEAAASSAVKGFQTDRVSVCQATAGEHFNKRYVLKGGCVISKRALESISI